MAFALTRREVNSYFLEHFGVPLGKVLAAAYQITAGVRYRIVFDTELGIAQVTCLTVYWERSVQIESVAFIRGTVLYEDYPIILEINPEAISQN